MTIDEALAKVTDPEVKAFLQKVINDQNGYVTRLESQINELKKGTPQQSNNPADDITRKYIEETMRRDIIKQASDILKTTFDPKIVEACMPDYTDFLNKNMKPNNTTVDYALDAFNLVYGRCVAKKDHPVHNVGKATTPSGTPAPQAQVGNNAQGVQQVASLLQGQPPVMTGKDVSAGSGLPGTQGVQIKNTRDAFSRLNEKIRRVGSSKFQ